MTDHAQRQTTLPTSTTTLPNASARTLKRPYKAPTLTQYGRIDDLVDSGVVGSTTSVPTA